LRLAEEITEDIVSDQLQILEFERFVFTSENYVLELFSKPSPCSHGNLIEEKELVVIAVAEFI
jgi:hypothetical protein